MSVALFFDTETTGLYSWQDPEFVPKVVQVGAILQDTDSGRVLAEMNFLNADAGRIPEEATKIHGVTTDLARNFGVPIGKISILLQGLIRRADVVVAHNLEFDAQILADNCLTAWQAMEDKQQVCTMLSNREIVKAPLSERQIKFFAERPYLKESDYKNPSLAETYKHYFDADLIDAHDAMADVRACRDVFMASQVRPALAALTEAAQ